MGEDQEVLEAFYNIITDSKQKLFDKIAKERTRYLTVVMESVHKEHNSSAVLRTCDCFGIQDLYTIEKGVKRYIPQRDIALGAGNWVDLYTYSEGDSPTVNCLQDLKKKGYRIVATTPHTEKSINDVDISGPIALVFGTERTGISEDVVKHADELVKIPMYGFTESFNISVSAAICLSIMRNKLEENIEGWKLSEEEQVKLKIKWATKILKNGEKIEQEIRKRVAKTMQIRKE